MEKIMREIKLIGQIKKGSRNYLNGIYECPECKKHVIKIAKDGRVANYCSHKCYAKNRGYRGSYKPEGVVISGYRYVYSPYHPYSTNHNYVAEHRLVAEGKLGRYLKPNEVVHHIDEDKLNNDPKNIMVLTNSEHIKYHKSKNYTPCEIVS